MEGYQTLGMLTPEDVAELLKVGVRQARRTMALLGAVRINERGELRLSRAALQEWMGGRWPVETLPAEARPQPAPPSGSLRIVQPRTKPKATQSTTR